MALVTNQEFITKEKKADLEQELKNLETVRRKEILDALEYAKSLGDLSENAEYHQARDEQARLEDRVQTIKSILQNATIVKQHHSDIVEVGTTVIVKKKGAKTEQEFQLVGSEEVDMAAGKISHNSPLGEALLGKKKGEKASFETPVGVTEYTIVKIK
jgi:transcription elongation factor GreA